jgi:hypothetical protein
MVISNSVVEYGRQEDDLVDWRNLLQEFQYSVPLLADGGIQPRLPNSLYLLPF